MSRSSQFSTRLTTYSQENIFEIRKEISSSSLWRDKDQSIITCIIKYIRFMEKNSRVPIIDFKHLSYLLSISKKDLFLLISPDINNYRQFNLKKKTGGTRKISVPSRKLSYCQYWIKENILNHFNEHDCAHGYAKNKSIMTNARNHLLSKQLLKIDLKDFFPSISHHKVENIFSSLGYPDNVSSMLANLCTMDGTLPQGAPTSPIISNIVFFEIDEKIRLLCSSLNLIYSRYADDIFISGDDITDEDIKNIKSIIECEGFTINDKKTRKICTNDKIITGLRVSDGKIFLTKKKKNKIKNSIFYVKKISQIGCLDRCEDPYFFERCLSGLYFWQSVEFDNIFVKESIIEITNLKKSFFQKIF